MKVYYDGVQKMKTTTSKWIPRVNEYIYLSVGAAFNLSGNQYFVNQPIGHLTEAYVDYIRVWKPLTTALNETSFEKSLNVCSDNKTIEIVSSRLLDSIRLYDLSGSMVCEKRTCKNKVQSIDVSSLAKGVYVLKLVFDNETVTKKISIS